MIAALGFLAPLLSISLTWPQVWRSCRHRRTLGLSPTSAWLAVALNLCWLTFGVLIGDLAQMVTNAVVGVGNGAVLIAVLLTRPELRTRRMLLRTAIGAAGLAGLAVLSLAAVALHADRVAVAAGLSSVVSLVGAAAALPQPVSLLRDRTQDVSGLSAARYRLGVGSAASWTSYGWLNGEPGVWMSAGVGLCCALLMCALLRSRRTVSPVRPVVVRRPVITPRPALVAAAA
jgi:uncharacterized protein with PQ loop repeat